MNGELELHTDGPFLGSEKVFFKGENVLKSLAASAHIGCQALLVTPPPLLGFS